MKTILILTLVLVAFAHLSAFGQEEARCKITTRKKMKSGKAKVNVERVVANNREECKMLAREKENNDDSDVENITASYGWQE